MIDPVIERGIPIPLKFIPRREPRYPFRKMEVGESFFMPAEDYAMAKAMRRSLGKTAREQARGERKFSLRALSDGVRVWRVQ